MQVRRPKRFVDGVILLDKPAGFSSNQALQRVKHLFKAAKAGHTGNLDPFATGLLPICLGEATKFSQTLLDADKEYRATIRLGVSTTTGDTEGEITSSSDTSFSSNQVMVAVHQFKGEITQIPPMHSALKFQGKALYEYARAGVEIERQLRHVTIHDIELEDYSGHMALVRVSCSKGTYIRVLAEDIGKVLGCGAHLQALRRLKTGGFLLKDAYTLEQLDSLSEHERDALLLPVDSLLQALPEIQIDAESAHFFCQGQAVWHSGVKVSGNLRVYYVENSNKKLLGLAENLEDGRITPRRLIVTTKVNS